MAGHPRRRVNQLPKNKPLPLIYRLRLDRDVAEPTQDPLARDRPLAMIEALLFAAEEPVPLRKLAQVAGLADAASARKLLRQLTEFYDRDGSAFQIEELAGGFQLLTRPEYHRWLARFGPHPGQELRLTGPSRETLAIVAYRQPIMRADIEAIRGVHCGETLRLLMEKGLIKIAGRDKSLGRPVLYGTTKKFLQVFGLRSLKELPRAEEFRRDVANQGSD